MGHPVRGDGHYQFARGSRRASVADTDSFRTAIARYDCRLEIACDLRERTATELRLRDSQREAAKWLKVNSSFFASGGVLPDPSARAGDQRLYTDLATYMTQHHLGAMEATFVRQFVSNPYAGEVVKGHRIVLAEMGLAPYEGSIVRSPTTFDYPFDREHRRTHIETRLGFVRALFSSLNLPRNSLYRGVASRGSIEPPRNHSLVSTSFSRVVAQSHLDGAEPGMNVAVLAQEVPVERVLMTYLETLAMTEPFQEAEAVLLFDPDNPTF